MLRSNSRRGSRHTLHLWAAVSATALILLSLLVLHSRLSSPLRQGRRSGPGLLFPSDPDAVPDSDLLLLDDADNDAFDAGADDRIDVLDDVEEESGGVGRRGPDDDETAHGTDEEDDADGDDADTDPGASGGFFWDHAVGVKRQAFGRRQGLGQRIVLDDSGEIRDQGKAIFASDDFPVDEEIRMKLDSIRSIEDALLIKASGGVGGNPLLRDGWAKWFDSKGRFLRTDRMFASSLELMNPMNHPMLQDPDAQGLTGLTRGDKLVKKALLKEIEKAQFLNRGDTKTVKRKALNLQKSKRNEGSQKNALKDPHIYPDGKRWGYYPGLPPHLSFAEFMDKFFGSRHCSVRVFMVWNSPPWSYGVRHQRGLESLLYHHRDACVVVFTETLELDFFEYLVKEGFQIAVAMPNLDELLNGTPLHLFASAWSKWRKTKYYSLHYSELVRLAALYKYGGIYLDSDIIVLRPLNLLANSLGIENKSTGSSTYSGAVMAFANHSPFIMECMSEYYSTYDETRLRWNGAELLTRVVNRLSRSNSIKRLGLKIEDSFSFCPINSLDIARYFAVPANETEQEDQKLLLRKILEHSITFHFWNSVTSALVPEPGSLVDRILSHFCIHCHDVL